MEDDDRPLEYTAELWQLMPDDAKPLLREEVEMNREHAEKTMRWLRSAPDTIEAAKDLVSRLYRVDDWWRIIIMLNFWDNVASWDERRILLGAGLSVVHKRGKHGGSLLMQSCDIEDVDDMFRAAHADGLHFRRP